VVPLKSGARRSAEPLPAVAAVVARLHSYLCSHRDARRNNASVFLRDEEVEVIEHHADCNPGVRRKGHPLVALRRRRVRAIPSSKSPALAIPQTMADADIAAAIGNIIAEWTRGQPYPAKAKAPTR
jgi:hypothetical protein